MGRTTTLPSTQELLSPAKAAAILGCSRQNVNRLFNKGKLAGERRGKKKIFVTYQSVAALKDALTTLTVMSPLEVATRLMDLERRLSLLEMSRGHQKRLREKTYSTVQANMVRAEIKRRHPLLFS